MKRFLMTVTLTCLLSVSAFAGNIPTVDFAPPAPGNIPTVGDAPPVPGNIPTVDVAAPAPGEVPTVGVAATIVLTVIGWLR